MIKVDEKTINARIAAERQRTIENVMTETEIPTQVWWLSFASEESFLGAILIHANNFIEATMRAHLMEINPGGECKGIPMATHIASIIGEEWKNRLLTEEECESFNDYVSNKMMNQLGNKG